MSSRVVDHRLGRRTGQIRRVMRGEFRLLFGSAESGPPQPPAR